MSQDDLPEVLRVYQAGLDTGQASFELRAPDAATWDSRYLPECRRVCMLDGGLVGWAALSAVSARACYAGVAEVSVYVDPASAGRGMGGALLEALIAASETAGIWTLQATIFPENEASLKLHRRHGFRVLGRRERIARHQGRWRDTQILERRSKAI